MQRDVVEPTPGAERAPGEGNGSPLQFSCLEKTMDRRAVELESIR